MGRRGIRLGVLLGAGLLAVAGAAHAYLPSAAEIRRFWEHQRTIDHPLYLRYEAAAPAHQVLEVMVRPDGLWAKRVRSPHQPTRTVWKWGRAIWQETDGDWKRGRRGEARWDDWVFEPLIDVLLELTPREMLQTRGLGRHPDGYLWLYGARHEQDSGRWFGLFKEPVRPGLWHTDNARVGTVRFFYEGNHTYPDRIRFARENRADFELVKVEAEWNPELGRLGFGQPARIEFQEAFLPPRARTEGDEDGDDGR